ncbi:MAG: Deoxyguanosinetriphosphate triphosphohydrolase-like protein [Acidobacteria bacterium]|nr:Deoxyguanosinetriphosphate triphosphohydrolase-like protein [Acidobacteriota bacterium]
MSDGAIRDRATLERSEDAALSFAAVRSTEVTRRLPLPAEGRQFDYRTAFQRDRDRIIHARSFRRLKHKTQVYVPHTGDHPRTRLTHTLEVAQIGRTVARALGLNEDLVEAIGLAHDLGHTPFGHSGEKTLARILAAEEEACPLPAKVVREVGTFKHNYQSLRVVDLLERRYDEPGLNLSDQVREGILKHTGWKARFPFPLPTTEGLRLGLPCHLEGQVVALADEIAQQTHDLEDGLYAEAVELEAVERLGAATAVIAHAGKPYRAERRRARRAAMLQRGLIHMFVTDAIQTTARAIAKLAGRHDVGDHAGWLAIADEIPAATVTLSRKAQPLFVELKSFIYQFIINHQEVNRQDARARLVIAGLFRAYWDNPLTLPTYALLRFHEETGRPYLRDLPIQRIPAEVGRHYHASAAFARLITDHLAGMSDRYALEEYAALYQPQAGPTSLLPGRM